MADEKRPDVIDPDPDSPASTDELAASARLREALDDPATPNDDADLARAVALGFEPRPIAESEHRAIVARALLASPRAEASEKNVIRVLFGTGATLALAAAILFFVGNMATERTARVELAKARSTQPLFDKPFKTGNGSARIDRIAMARSSDLRENRFAKWGVR
jgi:hypothetical protein